MKKFSLPKMKNSIVFNMVMFYLQAHQKLQMNVHFLRFWLIKQKKNFI